MPAECQRWCRGRNQPGTPGVSWLLAAPGHQVLRVLALTRLIGVFPVYASVDEAARSAVVLPAGGCAGGPAARLRRRT